MLWNSPGSQGGGPDPWRRKKQNAPPDLDRIFAALIQRFKDLFGKGIPTGGPSAPTPALSHLAMVAVLMVLVLYSLAGLFIVDSPERAVVTRLGRYVRTMGPGPHWVLPLVESKQIINVEQVSTTDHSGLMLTKDGNIVSVSVAVQYRIGADNDDVRDYLFNVVNPIRSLSLSAESALRQVIGQSTMDEVLTSRRAEIAIAIKEQLVETLRNYETGLWVLGVVTQFAKAPDEVRAAFDEVIKASADEERLVNQAEAYKNEVLPRARGNAERLKSEALGDQQHTILMAQGNVKRFNLVLPQYLKSPQVMQTRLYLETIESILAKTPKVIVDAGNNNLIYVPLDRLSLNKETREETTSSSVNPKDLSIGMPSGGKSS